MRKNLKQNAISGMIWSAVQKYSTMIISFLSGIILARLLTPYDYGCIGMLSIFMVLADCFIDGGFGSALIQKKNPTNQDYSTIFFWNMIVALLVYTILYCSAPSIARFYDIPLLSDVLRVQALVLFIHAFSLVQSNQLRKKLNFKLISIVTVATSIISLTVTIFMAYKGFGVWALVANNLISASIPAVVYWFYIKWRPTWTFSWSSFKELFGFGFYMFLTNLINQFSSQIQGLLIGKVYDPTTMGYYSKAHSTEKLTATSISSVISQVSYPLYAKVQDDIQMLITLIKKLTMSISYVTVPLMCVLILIAKPLFLLLYSDRWLPCVPYFQVLCVAGIVNCLMAVNTQTIAAIGKSRVMFSATLIKRVLGIGFIVGGLFLFGMNGLLGGVVLNSYFSYIVNILLVSKHIGYKWHRQLLDLLPCMGVSALSLVVSYFVVSVFGLGIYLDGLLKGIVFILSYIALSLLFKLEALDYTLNLIPKKFHFWEK